MTFNEASSSYIAALTQPRRRGALSPNSVRLYTLHANRLALHFGAVDLSEVKTMPALPLACFRFTVPASFQSSAFHLQDKL
jgi:hypothetical protein